MSIRKYGSRRSRKVISTLIAVLSAAGLSLGFSSAAQAAASNCPSSYSCIWKDTNYKTNGLDAGYIAFAMYINDFGKFKYAGTSEYGTYFDWFVWKGNATSVRNNGVSQSARFYAGLNKTGGYFQLAKGTGDGDVTNNQGYVQYATKPMSGYFSTYW